MISHSIAKTSIEKISGLKLRNKELDSILKSHPYFQLGLVEKSKRLRKENHIDAIKIARKCAILFPDRSLLYRLIHDAEKESKEIESAQAGESEENKLAFVTEEKAEVPGIIVKESDDSENLQEAEIKDPTLEKGYIAEAINQSIQIEIGSYQIEEEILDESEAEKESLEKLRIKRENDKILSFSEWIKNEDKVALSTHTFNNVLIDKFIQENPQVSKIQDKTFYSPLEKGKESLAENNLPFSETLASIFVEQGNKDLAIKAYKHLMLKNPQKSVYFADLIKKLEEKI